MKPPTHIQDTILYQAAYEAYAGTSHSPEARAKQCVESYKQGLIDNYNRLYDNIKTPQMAVILDREFARFSEAFQKKFLAALCAESRTMSTLIAGPANFPVESNRKKLDTARRRWDDLALYRERAMKAIAKKTQPELAQIRVGDPDSVKRLEQSLRDLEESHATMKTANKIIRSGKDVSDRLIKAGFSPEKAAEVTKPDCVGIIGYAPYSLRNNNARIRRVRNQLAAAKKHQSDGRSVDQESTRPFAGGRVVLDYVHNRLRIVYEEKPGEEVRSILKKNAFRWSPRACAWQRQLTTNAILAAERVVGCCLSNQRGDWNASS